MKSHLKPSCEIFSQPFNNRLWRQLLSNVCEEMKNICEMDIISPFGFELLENKNFLNKNIRRYYCYLGITKNNPILFSEISTLFRKKLFASLADYGSDVIDQFVLVIEQDNFIKLKQDDYICQSNDKALDIQCRYVRDRDHILDDYADYVICSIDSLVRKKSDCADFVYNKRHRNRIYQLYLMLESLFKHNLSPLTDIEYFKYKQIFRLVGNRIDIFFNQDLLTEPATNNEQDIYINLILPRSVMIQEKIKSKIDVENTRIQCHAYHIYDDLEVTISHENYKFAKDKIIKTYLRFI